MTLAVHRSGTMELFPSVYSKPYRHGTACTCWLWRDEKYQGNLYIGAQGMKWFYVRIGYSVYRQMKRVRIG